MFTSERRSPSSGNCKQKFPRFNFSSLIPPSISPRYAPTNEVEATQAMPKRAVRRRKSSVQYNEQDSSEFSDDGLHSDSSPPRKRVRGRAGAGGSRTKKAKAKQTSKLLEIPLDVTFEVS